MKKTTVPVNNLPTLKQKPVAEAQIRMGNNEGIYTANAPWLMPKKKANMANSTKVTAAIVLFVLKTTKVITKQAAKQISIVLRSPVVLTTHPEIKLPAIPLPAKIIIVMPRCCCTSADVDIL